MELQHLDKDQLRTLFLSINAQYLKIIDAPITSYIHSPEFLNLRKQLHEVMDELDSRRSSDPSIIHDHSPRGLDPDSFTEPATFLTD